MLFLNYAFLMPQNANYAERNASTMGLSLVFLFLVLPTIRGPHMRFEPQT